MASSLNEDAMKGFGDYSTNPNPNPTLKTINGSKKDKETEMIVVIEKTVVNIEENDISDEKINNCAHCKRPNPTYKCKKNHSKCSGKFFCDKKCKQAANREEKIEAIGAIAKNFHDAFILFWWIVVL